MHCLIIPWLNGHFGGGINAESSQHHLDSILHKGTLHKHRRSKFLVCSIATVPCNDESVVMLRRSAASLCAISASSAWVQRIVKGTRCCTETSPSLSLGMGNSLYHRRSTSLQTERPTVPVLKRPCLTNSIHEHRTIHRTANVGTSSNVTTSVRSLRFLLHNHGLLSLQGAPK